MDLCPKLLILLQFSQTMEHCEAVWELRERDNTSVSTQGDRQHQCENSGRETTPVWELRGDLFHISNSMIWLEFNYSKFLFIFLESPNLIGWMFLWSCLGKQFQRKISLRKIKEDSNYHSSLGSTLFLSSLCRWIKVI